MFFAVTASRSRAESFSVQIYLVKHIRHRREDDDPYFARSCACVYVWWSRLWPEKFRSDGWKYAVLRSGFFAAVPISGSCGNKRHKFSESCDLAVVFPLQSSFCSCRKLQSRRRTLKGSLEQLTIIILNF